MAKAKSTGFTDEELERELQTCFQKCWHLDVGQGKLLRLVINPVVFGVSFAIIWIFVIACMASPDYMLKLMNMAAFDWISEVWTWLYIVSQDIWILVLFYLLAVAKYGNIKLGGDLEEPEYSFPTWFSMLFSAGVAVGLFYYSVAEPMWHYKGWGTPWFHSSAQGYGNHNEDGTNALMVTFYHWGLHGWIPYTTMGAVMGIMTYRRGYPMTVRYCFYPLLGDRVFGWMGDSVDILSIMTTLFGVCTSLGLGAMQVNTALQRLNWGFYRGVNYRVPTSADHATPGCEGTGQMCGEYRDENMEMKPLKAFGIQTNVGTQCTIIAIITLLATASVVSGMSRGIVNLSRFNFALGMLLVLTVMFLGETYFILDAIVQATGYYFWILPRVGFHTDAFVRLGSKALGLGGEPSGGGGGAGWLTGWTIFYWGWWISWGPFVGTFLAKISRGRTLRQFIVGTLLVPTLYSCFWFGVFGAEGIRMQRMADGSGLCSKGAAGDCTTTSSAQISSKCASYSASFTDDWKTANQVGWNPSCVLDPAYHDGFGKCKEFRWTRWVQVADECVESTSWVSVPCGGGADPTAGSIPPSGPCASKITADMVDSSSDSKQYNHFPASTQPSCFVPLQDSVVCLWNQGTNDIFFDQLASYGPRGFSDLLCIVALVALILYFVTSSDSGSLVIDIMSANGHPEPPLAQRILWSFTEGTTACALLAAGRNLPNSEGSLRALQSASLIMGLPYTFLLFWCCQSLFLLAKEESGELDPNRKAFRSFIFAPAQPVQLLINFAFPGWTAGKVIAKIGGWPFHSKDKPQIAMYLWGVALQGMYLLSIILVICAAALYNWCVVGLVFYIGFGTFVGFLRAQVRYMYDIGHGDLVSDLLCGIFVPMFALAQMQDHVENDTPGKAVKNEEKKGTEVQL